MALLLIGVFDRPPLASPRWLYMPSELQLPGTQKPGPSTFQGELYVSWAYFSPFIACNAHNFS